MSKQMQQNRWVKLVVLLPLIAVFIWSLNIAVTRYVADYISPVSISFYRWLVAFIVLTPVMLPKVWQQRQLVIQHWKQFAVLSAFGMLLYQGLAYSAAHYTTATNMGIINAFIPIFRTNIDQCWVSKKIKVTNFYRGDDIKSDHFPIVAELKID